MTHCLQRVNILRKKKSNRLQTREFFLIIEIFRKFGASFFWKTVEIPVKEPGPKKYGFEKCNLEKSDFVSILWCFKEFLLIF